MKVDDEDRFKNINIVKFLSLKHNNFRHSCIFLEQLRIVNMMLYIHFLWPLILVFANSIFISCFRMLFLKIILFINGVK